MAFTVTAVLFTAPAIMRAQNAPAPPSPPAAAASAPANASATTQPAAPTEPDRRGLPAPFDSPPFPLGDYLGPVIGTRDTVPSGPFENLIKDTAFERGLRDYGIRVGGWVDVGANLSTSAHSNVPESYDIVPNAVELDQFVFTITRTPDTMQTNHIDWGFNSSTLYGIDYRWTTAKGWGSDQLLQHNNLYGIDPTVLNFQLYFPQIAQGTLVTIGRYISPPDIEAQFAPQNYLYSHSVMFDWDAYTYTGINAAIKLDDHWTTLVGVHAGNDMAPWTNSAAPNGQFLVRWVSGDNCDSIWGGIASMGDGKFRNGHDNLQQFNATWTHKFSQNIHTTTEMYYMFQYDAELGGTPSFGPVRSFGGGGGPGPIIPGRSQEWGAVNYTEFKLSDRDYLTIRNDFMADTDGQRTGFVNNYSSWTVGWARYLVPNNLLLRPEVRYDRAWTRPAYNNGTRKNQFTVGVDLIFFF
jgi:hypothetical protein